MKRRLGALKLLLASLLVACGPIYSTDYDYDPPEDSQGRACVSMCRSARSYCEMAAEARAEREELRCELEAERDYDRCLARGEPEDAHSCHRRPCIDPGVNDAHCAGEFRNCYRDCGGEVEAIRTCRFNCPERPPAK